MASASSPIGHNLTSNSNQLKATGTLYLTLLGHYEFARIFTGITKCPKYEAALKYSEPTNPSFSNGTSYLDIDTWVVQMQSKSGSSLKRWQASFMTTCIEGTLGGH
jgi:hypothetical protein